MTIDELAALMDAMPRPKRRELRCHPSVARYLELTTPERKPDPPWSGSIGHLTGIPVIPVPEMEPGAWELHEDGEVIHSGFHALAAALCKPIEFEFTRIPTMFERYYLSGWVSDVAPPAYRAYLGMPSL